MLPLERYQHDLDHQLIVPDPAQSVVIRRFNALYQALLLARQFRQKPWRKLRRRLLRIKRRRSVQGIYVWGEVGVGKTYLMDLFYRSLPFEEKHRSHFHQFMKMIHDELNQHQGHPEPLTEIAKNLSQTIDVLCFDEFFVTDITDAMILAKLLKALFEQGICLVATSNIAPDDLYKNGLQRERFLPAIDCIKTHTDIIELKTTCDYRRRILESADTYLYPCNKANEEKISALFKSVTKNAADETHTIDIQGRQINAQHHCGDTIWFDFDALCSPPRSQLDYIELAHLYRTIFISEIPKIEAHETDRAQYFINLIDVLYDANVKVILNAEVPIDALYPEGKLTKAFERTRSRLMEMQSKNYLFR